MRFAGNIKHGKVESATRRDITRQDCWYVRVCAQAPTESNSGTYPSLRARSSLLTSSIDVAFAMAALTLSCSSFESNLPALPGMGALGSSIVNDGFPARVDTLEMMLVASAFSFPSAVKKSDLAASRS